MSILQTAHAALNSDSLTGIAEHLAIDSQQVPGLIEGSLSALLAIFQQGAQDPAKAELITQFLAEVDPSIIANPQQLIAEQGAELTRSGKSGLAKLLGPQLTDYIAPLAKSTGLGEGKVAAGLGTLAPFVIALLSKETQSAEGLQQLLANESLTNATPDSKVPTKEAVEQKSYLPDPSKKKEKRPFPKRKAALIAITLLLVVALAFWVFSTGLLAPTPAEVPIPEPIQTSENANAASP